jgi:hypothetical protein
MGRYMRAPARRTQSRGILSSSLPSASPWLKPRRDTHVLQERFPTAPNSDPTSCDLYVEPIRFDRFDKHHASWRAGDGELHSSNCSQIRKFLISQHAGYAEYCKNVAHGNVSGTRNLKEPWAETCGLKTATFDLGRQSHSPKDRWRAAAFL